MAQKEAERQACLFGACRSAGDVVVSLGFRLQIEGADVVALFGLELLEADALGGHLVFQHLGRVVDRRVDVYHPVEFGEALGDPEGELLDVILLGVVFVQHLLEESGEVVEQGNQATGGVEGVGLSVGSQFHPFDPDGFVELAVEILAVLLEVVAFCGRSEATRAKVEAEDPGRAFYHDYREMLASAEVDAVLVLTPIPLNATVTMATLRAGKDVFVEKPLARTADEAGEVIEVIHETHQRVFVLEQVAWQEMWLRTADLVRSGRLGKIVLFDRASHRLLDADAHTRGGYGKTTWRIEANFPFGMLMDGGIHEIAGLRMLFGPPVSVQAWGQNVRETFGDWDVVEMLLDYPGGVRGLFHHSGLLPEGSNGFHIRGTDANAVVERNGMTIQPNDGENERIDFANANTHEIMWRALAGNFREGSAPAYTTADAQSDLRTLDAIGEAIRGERRVDLG